MSRKPIINHNTNRSFCAMPWVGISGDMDGKFRLCCFDDHTRHTGELGNIKDITVKEYWNQTALKEIRRKMLLGEKLPHCTVCYKREQLGAKSARIESIINYSAYIPQILSGTQEDGYTDSHILYMDMRFSNICNLACRMCFAGSSTGRIELDTLLGEKDFLQEYSGVWKTSNIFESDFLLQSLQHVYIAGGEPFLDKDQADFVQMLIDKGVSKQIELEYNTNLTFIPSILGEIFSKFKKIKVIVSCDGYGKNYEYIRIGAKWDIFTKNLSHMKKLVYASGVDGTLKVNIVLQRDNIQDIPKLYVFFKKVGKIRITINALVRPKPLSIEYITNQSKEKIASFYRNSIQKLSPQFPKIFQDLSFIIDILEKRDTPEDLEKKYGEKYYTEKKIIDTYSKKFS